jgi:lipoate---protein ligase
MSFTLIEQSGRAETLFADTDAALASVSEHSRIIRVLTVDAPAVVLGSAQDPSVVIQSTSPVDVVRRRSGGGAVWLDRESMVWFDIIISRSDALWQADVGQSMWWVGELFTQALVSLGVTNAVTHQGAMVRHELDRTICWTGLGPGEVTTGAGGPKLVGVAQKRVRDGALFQVGVLLAESQFRLASIFGLGEAEAAVVRSERPVLVSAREIVNAVRNQLADYS